MRTLIDSHTPKIDVGPARESEVEDLARWITATGEAPQISSLRTELLSPAALEQWLADSCASRVARVGGAPIGLATLSTREADHPPGTVELCHLIVHPAYRRLFNGTLLVAWLLWQSRDQGFKRVVARVLPGNRVARTFFGQSGWVADSNAEPPEAGGFVWYRKARTG